MKPNQSRAEISEPTLAPQIQVTHRKQIDELLTLIQSKKRDDKVAYQMTVVAWYLEKETGIPASEITQSDCCYFVLEVGTDYLKRHLRGVGETRARHLREAAQAWTAAQIERHCIHEP